MFTYEQTTGKLYTPTGTLLGTGYAGRGEGKNNPVWEAVKDYGPLPVGMWTLIKLWKNHPVVGEYAIELQPDESTRIKILSYGRDPIGFFSHGENPSHIGESSDGCIILWRTTRLDWWENGDRQLHVIARRPKQIVV